MKPFDFKTSNYFTGMPYVAGFVFCAVAILLGIAGKFVPGGILLLAGLCMITSHYRLLIDFSKNTYVEYVSILGMKTSREPGRFNSIEYLFIKKNRVSQTLNSRVQSTTIQKWRYDGFLKFSEHNKVHIISSENKSAVSEKLRSLAKSLNSRVVDYSNETSVDAHSS
jgi:hypothetical protein